MAVVCIFQLSVHVALDFLVTNHHACHHVAEWYFECVMFVLSQFVVIVFDAGFK